MPQVVEPGFLQPHQRRALCGTCPIKVECLAWGVKTRGTGTYAGVELSNGRVLILPSRASREMIKG